MRILVCCLALALTACGPKFEGRWTGLLSDGFTCIDGYSTTENTNNAWTISENLDGTLSVVTDKACETITADVAGTVATFRAKSCRTFTTSSTNGRFNLTGGTLTNDGKKLSVDYSVTLDYVQPVGHKCYLRPTGSLFL